jgi:hypothetical protein
MLILRPAHRKPLATVILLHGKKRRARCSTGLNNVLLPTLFTLVDNIEQCCWAWIGCNNIVQHCWQCGQQSIVQSCFHQYCNNLSVFCRVKKLDDIIPSPSRYHWPLQWLRRHAAIPKTRNLSWCLTMDAVLQWNSLHHGDPKRNKFSLKLYTLQCVDI